MVRDYSADKVELNADVSISAHHIDRIASLLRSPILSGDHGCPEVASRSQVFLISTFPAAPRLVVSIGADCGTVTNGSLVGSFASRSVGPTLVSMLREG